MEEEGGHVYIARSGLISQGIELPNHNDIFNHQLSADGTTLKMVAEKNGVIYQKTYTVKHQWLTVWKFSVL
jgi:YidC/Oxa1 family membrane protein insertase